MQCSEGVGGSGVCSVVRVWVVLVCVESGEGVGCDVVCVIMLCSWVEVRVFMVVCVCVECT